MKKVLLSLLLCLCTAAAWADLPYRNHRFDAFKTMAPAEGSILFIGNSITETPTTITYTIDKANGATYRGGNESTAWCSAWKSTKTDPQLTLTTSANNMQWKSNGSGDNLILATGNGGSCTFTFNAPDGYYISGYSYTVVNDGHTNAITVSNSGSSSSINSSSTEQTVSETDKALCFLDITLKGGNHSVTFKNFTVTLTQGVAPSPELPKFSTTDNVTWYYIVNASTLHPDKAIYYDPSYDGGKLRFNTKDFNPAFLWSFWKDDNGKIAIKNYNGQYFGTAGSGTGGSTAFGVQEAANYIYSFVPKYGQYLIKDTDIELHAQTDSAVVVRWAANNPNSASLWKFEEVDVSNSQLTIVSTTVEQGKVTTGIGNKDLALLRVTLNIEGLTGSATVSINGQYTGTDAKDVTAVKAYIASNDRELFIDADKAMPWREENGTKVGETTLNADGTFSLPISQGLTPGRHYVWVTFDVATTAKEGNLVDARITSYDIVGATSVVEENGDPTNAATIFLSEGTALMPWDRDVKCYRIPALTMVTKDDGTVRLIAVADSRQNHGADLPSQVYTVAQYSDDYGKTWSIPDTIAGTEDLGGAYGHGDASIVTNRDNGDIIVIVTSSPHGKGYHSDSPETRPAWKTIISHDNGETWEKPVDHTDDLYGAWCTDEVRSTWKSGFSGSGAALQMRDGTLVSSFTNRQSDNSQHFFLIMSNDGGANWFVSGTSGCNASDEPKTLERNNGDLAISVRASGYNYHNVTSDRGMTWKYTPHTRFNTGISGNACDGEYMVWCSTLEGNPWDIAFQTLPYNSNRRNVSIALSLDEGTTFLTPKTICPTNSAYSAAVVLPDGTLGVFYEEDGVYNDGLGYTMRFVRFSLDWASDGKYQFTDEQPFHPIASTKGIERKDVTYTITDDSGKTFTGTVNCVALEKHIKAAVAGLTVAGCSVTDVKLSDDLSSATARLVHPLPVSGAGIDTDKIVNMTMISTFDRNDDERHNYKWFADNDSIRIIANGNATYQNVLNYMWTFEPTYNEETNSFTYKMRNVGTGKYVYSTATTNSHAAGTVTLGDNGTDLTYTADRRFSFKTSSTMYLSVNSISTTNQLVGAYDDTHAGTVTTMPAAVYTCPITSVGAATLYTPFAVSIPEGVEAKYLIDTENTTSDRGVLRYKKLNGIIPGGTAVVLIGDGGTDGVTYTFTKADEAESVSGNLLFGYSVQTDKPTDATGIYALGNYDGTAMFGRFVGTVYKAGKAYLNASSISVTNNGEGEARYFYIFDEDVETGIIGIESTEPETEGAIYDLSGRRVEKATKGVFIINGKKVIK